MGYDLSFFFFLINKIINKGINKFTKKFRKPPGFVDSIEVLDFLSRVPSKKELFKFKEELIQNNGDTNNVKNINKKKRKTS